VESSAVAKKKTLTLVNPVSQDAHKWSDITIATNGSPLCRNRAIVPISARVCYLYSRSGQWPQFRRMSQQYSCFLPPIGRARTSPTLRRYELTWALQFELKVCLLELRLYWGFLQFHLRMKPFILSIPN